MLIKAILCSSILALVVGCSSSASQITHEFKNDTVNPEIEDSKRIVDSLKLIKSSEVRINDTLNALANIMSGIADSSSVYKFIQVSSDFKVFSKNFNKRWTTFDSSCLTNLRNFGANEISKVVKRQSTLFYPFSGPDILYAQTFFPEADKYVMIGLEPVGSLPDFKKEISDSLDFYFNKVNKSLNTILQFSFFRTASMSKDIKNAEVDGTVHLLFLFLKRTGNSICSAKPVIIDSLGNTVFLNSFKELKRNKSITKGVEIKFRDKNNKPKEVLYFSLNATDASLKYNNGIIAYLKSMGTINTYLKSASYLMHNSYFSVVRSIILNQSEHVVQDDSGIAFRYFLNDNNKWDYSFFGQYLKPIPRFSGYYQKVLDSLYRKEGSKPIGFGIGYNFRDKNSNFMIASKKK
jgi:hypothetical protein